MIKINVNRNFIILYFNFFINPYLIYIQKNTILKIIELLDMNNIKDRKWNVVETSMANGKGIIESFDWLSETL